MGNTKRLSKGTRKYIRRKKAEIKEILDKTEQKRLIEELMSKFNIDKVVKKQ
ncbi:MAG: hypothetical protein KKC53_01370 [Actinobacteria bacterium]|nr:hypothetical protein [Actinomycetota bacterium]